MVAMNFDSCYKKLAYKINYNAKGHLNEKIITQLKNTFLEAHRENCFDL